MSFFGLGSKNVANATIKVGFDGKEAEKGLKNFKKIVGTVISAVVVKKVAEFSWELANLGATAEVVAKNFENWAQRNGSTVEEMTSRMRRATKGMISDMELQQKAMAAMISGVNFDDVVTAMDFVSNYAISTGKDVNQKLESVMTGFARKSAQFLDDVGIQVMGAEDVVGAAIDQMNEKMVQFSTTEEDAAVQAGQLKANLTNLKIAIGKELQPAFIKLLGVMNDVIVGFQHMTGLGREGQKKAAAERAVEILKEIELEQKLVNLYENYGKMAQAASRAGGQLAIPKPTIESYQQALKNIKELREESEKLRGKPEKTGPLKSKPIIDEKSVEEEQRKQKKILAEIDKRIAKEKQMTLDGIDDLSNEILRTQEQLDEMLKQEAEERADTMLEIQRDSSIARIGIFKTEYLERKQILDKWAEDFPQLIGDINIIRNDLERQAAEERKRIDDEEAQHRINNANSVLGMVGTINNALINLNNSRTQKELQNINKLNISEEKKEKKRAELQEKAAKENNKFLTIQQGLIVAQATMDAIAMGVGAGKDAFGGPVTRILAMGTALAAAMVEVAAIQNQKFQSGIIGDVSQTRQADTIPALIGPGETVIDAPTTARHEPTIRSMMDGTANTNMMSPAGKQIVNNFYGLTQEQFNNAKNSSERFQETGLRI